LSGSVFRHSFDGHIPGIDQTDAIVAVRQVKIAQGGLMLAKIKQVVTVVRVVAASLTTPSDMGCCRSNV
jgi:hypothetical protein